MKKEEKEFQKYLESKGNFENKDFSKIEGKVNLEQNFNIKKKCMSKPLKIVMASLICLLCVPIVCVSGIGLVYLSHSFSEEYKYVAKKVQYTLNDEKMYKDQSFKALNSITYPQDRGDNEIDSSLINGLSTFSYNLVKSDLNNSNYLISTLSAYFNLNIISLLSSSNNVNEEFDFALQANKETRSTELKKILENNFYKNDYGTTQIYNSVFFNNQYELNNQYVNILSKNYTEAYSMDFTYDNLDKIINWMKVRTSNQNSFSKDDFEFDESSIAYILSTLYFNNKWSYSFSENSSFDSNFINGEEKTKVRYMHHEYGSVYKQTEDYFSFFDYYQNGYKIKYIISNSYDISTLDALKNTNFVATNVDDYKPCVINLDVPKMKYSYKKNIMSNIKSLGINTVFNKDEDNFPDLFENTKDSQYISFIKQSNTIEFDETGTIATSITMSGMKSGSAAPGGDDNTFFVKLDQPFAYVIYDQKNIPLFVGYYANK